jgi:hypothetical protein
MRESVDYQRNFEEGRREGRLEGARRMLVRLGTKCLGPPTEAEINTLSTITDLERLERMMDRLVTPANWRVLLNIP